MKIRYILCLLMLSPGLLAQDFSKLPDWARPHAEAASRELAPEADTWVLLDRTEVAYAGDGEVRTHRYRLVKVLGERGLDAGTFVLWGLGGNTSKVKKLKGWNLRPDGELEKLDHDYTFSLNSAGSGEYSTQTLSGGALTRVAKGSLVAFESLQVVHHPLGPVDDTFLMESSPIRRWELEVGKKEGWFTNLKQVEVHMDLHHFAPWIQSPETEPGRRVSAWNVPGLPKDEGAHPDARNFLPRVSVRFIDPDLKGVSGWDSWDAHAAWTEALFKDKAVAAVPASMPVDPRQALEARSAWMRRELAYKQVYLTPDRGWVPESSTEVIRRHYGDCKDLACTLIAESRSLGLKAYPVLARIGGGVLEPDEPPYPGFDHAIVAVRLDKSWGLPAEVQTSGGLFLLVDPTDRFTPLGRLAAYHRGGRVMICAEGKAIWTSIPDSALLKPRVSVDLDGTCAETGRLEAMLILHEQGDAWGLRSTSLLHGAVRLQELLSREVLDLPPTGKLEMLSQGDPLDLDRAFEVKLKVVHPEGFKVTGSEGRLPTWGMRLVPPVVQKPGLARTYPVEVHGFGALDYHATLKLPRKVQPSVPNQHIETVRHILQWRAAAPSDATGSQLELGMEEEDRDALYAYADRQKGVADLKRDRNEMRDFVSDALSFKLLP